MIQLLIYTQYSSSRIDYIFSTLLNASGIDNHHFTTDKLSYTNSAEAKINYSTQRITEDEIWIQPAHLLFETEIKEQQIVCFDNNGYKAFFKTSFIAAGSVIFIKLKWEFLGPLWFSRS